MPTDIADFMNKYGWMGIAILLMFAGFFRLFYFKWAVDEKNVELVKKDQEHKEAMDKERAETVYWRERYFDRVDKTDKAIDILNTTVDLLREKNTARKPTT